MIQGLRLLMLFTWLSTLSRCLCSVKQANEPTLLHAVRSNKLTTIRDLVAKKADLNAQDQKGHTALMLLANNFLQQKKSFLEIAQTLIDAKADLHVRNIDGKNALIIATECWNTDMVQLLIKAMEQNHQERLGWIYDKWSIAPLELINVVLEPFMKSIEDEDNCGETALSIAIAHQDIVLIKILLQAIKKNKKNDFDALFSEHIAERDPRFHYIDHDNRPILTSLHHSLIRWVPFIHWRITIHDDGDQEFKQEYAYIINLFIKHGAKIEQDDSHADLVLHWVIPK